MTDVSTRIRNRDKRRELVRRLIVVFVCTMIAAVGSWFVGLDVWHAVVVGCAVAACGLTWIAPPETFAPTWPAAPGESFDGVRQDISRLSWSLLTRRGRVRDTVFLRVRGLARHRLGRRQLNLDDPADGTAIQRLIGDRAYGCLGPGQMQAPGLRTLVNCLDALDHLEAGRGPQPHTQDNADRADGERKP